MCGLFAVHVVRGRIGEELVAVILWTRVRRKYEFRCHGRTDTRMGSERNFAYL